MANFEDSRIGFGQVEPNQLSAQKTGQIYASLPLDENVQVLQNGEFMYYSYADNKVTAEPTVAGQEPMLVFNEIKIYEDLLMVKDFAMIRKGDNYVTNLGAVGRITSANTNGVTYGDGSLTQGATVNPGHTEYGYRMDGIAPRMFKTNIGDVMTTNMIKGADVAAKDKLVPTLDSSSKTLVLTKKASPAATDQVWVVAKVYTMPDGQPGVKIQRIQ